MSAMPDVDSLNLGSPDAFTQAGNQILATTKKSLRDMEDTTAKIKGEVTKLDGTDDDYQGRINSARAQYQKNIDQLQDDKPPQPNVRSPMEAFGGVATWLGILGGFLTRHPLVTGLKAATAAMNAYRQGDMDSYKQQYETWKLNTDHAIKMAQLQNDQVNSIINDKKASIDEITSRINALSAVNRDTQMQQQIQVNGLEGAVNLMKDRQLYTQRAQEGQLKMVEANATLNELHELHATEGYKSAPPDLKALMDAKITHPEEALKAQDRIVAPETEVFQKWKSEHLNATADEQAKFLASLKQSQKTQTPQSIAIQKYLSENPDATADDIAKFTQKLRSQGRSPATLATQKFMEENPDATPEQIANFALKAQSNVKADQSALTKLVGQQAAVSAYEQTAANNGKILVSLADKVDQTGVPVFERWTRAGKKAVAGDTDVSAFDTQMFLWRAEVAKILTNPNITGVLTDTARQEAEAFLGNQASAAQVKRVVSLVNADFKRREGSINNEISTIQNRIQTGDYSIKGAAGTKEDPIPITTEEDYAKVPSGQYIMTPEGYVKGPKP